MSSHEKYRSAAVANHVIGLSVSFQRDNLLARGLGIEHLRELLLRLARTLFRQGASLAYGGYWKRAEGNFTFDLLRLISAEQESDALGRADNSRRIGQLYNHSPWPDYLEVTPRIEAQWIDSCCIVRIDQEQAGIDALDCVPDNEAKRRTDRVLFNAAITLSAMRRLGMEELAQKVPGLDIREKVPAITARIILGGKVKGFSGFLPGLFEEALVTLERKRPLFVLGGFGGAAEVLAKAMLDDDPNRPDEFTLDWLKADNPKLARLDELSRTFSLPSQARTTAKYLDDIFQLVEQARSNLVGTLNTGLNESQTRELMTTRDMGKAVRLVSKGLGLIRLAE